MSDFIPRVTGDSPYLAQMKEDAAARKKAGVRFAPVKDGGYIYPEPPAAPEPQPWYVVRLIPASPSSQERTNT